ncbi:MAG: IS200/IS605 family accessory protein TnpB-related protein [Anaerobutyricum sp.]
MHKISTEIIRYCVEHRIGILVIGVNKLWKQKSSIGRRNNQNFVSVPYFQLRQMIEYIALRAGIDVIEQKRVILQKQILLRLIICLFTEKKNAARYFPDDVLNADYIHAKKDTASTQTAMERQTSLRKAIPDAWKDISDFHFLATPESIRFAMLNPADSHKRYKQHKKTGFLLLLMLNILVDMPHSK